MRDRVEQELRQIRKSIRIITELMKTVHFDDNLTQATELVCRELQLDYNAVVGPRRERKLVEARQMIYALNREEYSLAQLGEFMDGRDHSTVFYALHQHQALLDTDEQYRDKFNIIQQKFNHETTTNY